MSLYCNFVQDSCVFGGENFGLSGAALHMLSGSNEGKKSAHCGQTFWAEGGSVCACVCVRVCACMCVRVCTCLCLRAGMCVWVFLCGYVGGEYP